MTPADDCCHADRSSSRPVRTLDAAELAAAGVLVPGIFKAGRWGWWEGDRLEAAVGYHVDTRTPPGTVTLSGLGEAVGMALALVGGGDALAFRCPGCWSTTARLYLPEGDAVWRCAGCHSLGDSPGGREAS